MRALKQQRRIQLGAGAKLVLVMGELLLFLLLAQSVLSYMQTNRAYISAPRALPASMAAGQENPAVGGTISIEHAGKMAETEAQAELYGQERLTGVLRIAGVVMLIVFFHLFLAQIMRGIPPTGIPYP